jgi:hypothetical protein
VASVNRNYRKLTYWFAGLGGFLLVLAIFLSNLVLTIAGLAMIFWGTLLLFVTSTSYIKAEVVGPSFEGSIQAIKELAGVSGLRGRAVYLPPRSFGEVSAEKVMLSGRGTPEAGGELIVPNGGPLITAPGIGLVKYFQSKVDSDFLGVDFDYVKFSLPKLITEDLELAQEMEMVADGDLVRVVTVGKRFFQLCSDMSDSSEPETFLACPLHSSFAVVLARALGKPVFIESVERLSDNRTVKATYAIQGGSPRP